MPDNRTEDGIDQVEFWVRTNPGTRAGADDEGRLRRRARRASCWR